MAGVRPWGWGSATAVHFLHEVADVDLPPAPAEEQQWHGLALIASLLHPSVGELQLRQAHALGVAGQSAGGFLRAWGLHLNVTTQGRIPHDAHLEEAIALLASGSFGSATPGPAIPLESKRGSYFWDSANAEIAPHHLVEGITRHYNALPDEASLAARHGPHPPPFPGASRKDAVQRLGAGNRG